MFTHNPVTPVRLEILVDLLRKHPHGYARADLYRLLSPESLKPDLSQGSGAVTTVSAAIDLGLAEESSGLVKISSIYRKHESARCSILHAFDSKVLCSTNVEKYFAMFYAYYLFLGKSVYQLANKDSEMWAQKFNTHVFSNEVQEKNPFNEYKHSKLNTWFKYVGLGWVDPEGNLQANPYERILRVLPDIFSERHKLNSHEFMNRLATVCPELDGGEMFLLANRNWKSEDKQCSLGLSHALIELHEDEIIRLECPADCQDWSLKEAEPPRDDYFKGDRFESVEWRKK